jgi:hypothetical protein
MNDKPAHILMSEVAEENHVKIKPACLGSWLIFKWVSPKYNHITQNSSRKQTFYFKPSAMMKTEHYIHNVLPTHQSTSHSPNKSTIQLINQPANMSVIPLQATFKGIRFVPE